MARLCRVALVICSLHQSLPAKDDIPRVHDDRLELTLVAEHPDIVTPIGMVIDEHDRVFVIESHTHLRPRGYAGPTQDCVKVFVDQDNDGHYDQSWRFADGLAAAMNLALSPTGTLHAVCAREVVALEDVNRDGVCDRKTRVLHLDTTERYPHNSLLGITFAPDGWMYVSRGNVSSRAYTLVGTDGTTVSGYGDGGNIVRCRADGTQLSEFATGFWNPFDIKFDHAGRLLCVDNDPDARGPNRLLHVVQHGDYGYRSLYGGGGNHPFQGWDGTLPGVLPMINGTGEAPSGLLDGRRTHWPSDYEHSLLVTVWNENTIECHTTQPRGASLSAESRVLVSGGKHFRPVAIDADSNGNVFITDWVLVDYPNHGKGRIWRLSAAPGHGMIKPRGYFDAFSPDPQQRQLAALAGVGQRPDALEQIGRALRSGDPFLEHTATWVMTGSEFADEIPRLAANADPKPRLGGLLAAWRGHHPQSERLARQFLADSDLRIRQAALKWIGEERLSLRNELERAIRGPNVSGLLFETYLSAVENLDPQFVDAYRQRREEKSRDLPRSLPPGLIESIVVDVSYPVNVRALALARLKDMGDAAIQNVVLQLAKNSDVTIQREAIRQLGQTRSPESSAVLLEIVRDQTQGSDIRCQALLALSESPSPDLPSLLPLLQDRQIDVRVETARSLRAFVERAEVRSAFQEQYAKTRDEPSLRELGEQLEFALDGGKHRDRPATIDAWHEALRTGGDPVAGQRVFDSVHTMCSRCHTINGRGGALGPDLSNVAQSIDRQQIVQSILRPSDKFPPQYQAWAVTTIDGVSHVGLQLDHQAEGAIELLTTEGKTVRFSADNIDRYDVLPRSIMPDDLETTMTTSELRHLVAFLESLK